MKTLFLKVFLPEDDTYFVAKKVMREISEITDKVVVEIHPPTDEEIREKADELHDSDDFYEDDLFRMGEWMRSKIFGVLLFFLLLSSCAAPNYLDSEIEQDKEIYLAGGGWECNDTTWRKIEVK